MKATLMKFPYTVNTGDECKGPRLRTFEGHAILFEDGERKVLFVTDLGGRPSDFFEIIGTNPDGTPKFEGASLWDHCLSDQGPMESVEELLFTEEEIKTALAVPEARKVRQQLLQRCAEYVKN